MHSAEDAPDGSIHSLRRLRTGVLRSASTVLALAMPAIGVSILAQGDFERTSLVLGACALAFPLHRWCLPRLQFRVAASTLLGLLTLTCFLSATRWGAAAGNVAASMIVVLLAAVFFGKPGALWGLLAVVGAFVAAGSVVLAELGPRIDPSMWDPGERFVWVRAVIVLTVAGFVVAMIQTHVVGRLTDQATQARLAAQREHEQLVLLEEAHELRDREREQRLHAQAALEESRRIETLARLSGGIAHDFNNALTVIVGAADMARWSTTDPHVEQCLDDILQAAQGAGDLTRQLLTLGRRQVSKPESIAVGTLLARLETTVRRLLPSDIVFRMGKVDASLCVFLDPVQFERSLYNLVLNARDAMPKGGHLDVECRREPTEDGERVSISISDDGLGMDEETRTRIFEPFFTTKEVGRGTGLGLATVHAFALQANGSVEVSSEFGKGTTFTLSLPVHSPEPRPESRRSSSRPPRPVHSGKRILVVEDRDDVRATMVRMLSHGGFVVQEAGDGDAALRLLEDPRGLSLLCIDGVMPGTATADVIERARAVAPELPVLLCSGYVKEDLLRRGIETGRYAFLQKPFSPAELLANVHQLVLSRPAEPPR